MSEYVILVFYKTLRKRFIARQRVEDCTRRDLRLVPQIGSVPQAHFLINKMKHFIDKQYQKSDGAFNLIGTEASCTDVDMARGTVNDRFHALHVGFPRSVSASMGMGDLDTERNTLAANIALCQLLHLQS